MDASQDWFVAVLLIVVVHLVLIAIPLWFWANNRWDRDRVKAHIEERGGQLLSMKWTLDAPQFLFSRDVNARIYSVRFIDSGGETRQATCQTNWMSGVYLTEEALVNLDNRTPLKTEEIPRNVKSLEAELERLRLENAALKGDRTDSKRRN